MLFWKIVRPLYDVLFKCFLIMPTFVSDVEGVVKLAAGAHDSLSERPGVKGQLYHSLTGQHSL